MAKKPLTPEDLQAITEFAKQWGKIVVRRSFGDDGPGLDVDLDQMEQVANAAAKGLIAGTLEQATQDQAQQLNDSQPCPQCGRVCPLTNEPRTVHVQGGTFEHQDPKAHCPTCRRDFFPSEASSET